MPLLQECIPQPIKFESNIRHLATRSTLKKLRWTRLGAFSCCEYPLARNTLSLKLGRRYWNSREGRREGFLHLRRRECRGHKLHRELFAYFACAKLSPRRIFPPSYVARYEGERGLFPVKGHYSNFDRAPPKNISAKIGSRLAGWKPVVLTFKLSVIGRIRIVFAGKLSDAMRRKRLKGSK